MTFPSWVACTLLGGVLSAWRAHRQGYSRVLFGVTALLLGPGAFLLTWLLTREAARFALPQGTGLCPEDAGAVIEVEPEAMADLRSWSESYQSLRLGLYLTALLLSLGGLMSLYWLVCFIVPTVSALYEGMSLALPWSTQLLIHLAKFCRCSALAWPVFTLTPATLYLCLARLGYRTPMLGMVWQHLDELWLLQAQRAGGEHWRQLLPPSVGERVGTGSLATVADYDNAYRQVLLRLVASLWMLLPCALCILLVLAVMAGLLGMATVIPHFFHGPGNIGY